jgi:hypothetical protein
MQLWRHAAQEPLGYQGAGRGAGAVDHSIWGKPDKGARVAGAAYIHLVSTAMRDGCASASAGRISATLVTVR